MKTLSVVNPCFNEEGNFSGLRKGPGGHEPARALPL